MQNSFEKNTYAHTPSSMRSNDLTTPRKAPVYRSNDANHPENYDGVDKQPKLAVAGKVLDAPLKWVRGAGFK
jgi:hypothetical protein